MSETYGPHNCLNTRAMIWELFRDAADEDYLIARSAAFLNLQYQFSWSAQQALEKYLKSILLLNGYPIKEYGHKLTEMYSIADDIAGDLIGSVHCPPREIQNSIPPFGVSKYEPHLAFIRRINDNGSPDNRYRSFSMSFDWYDLHKLDEMVFLLRRISFPLDMEIENWGVTAREYLSKYRDIQIHKKNVI